MWKLTEQFEFDDTLVRILICTHTFSVSSDERLLELRTQTMHEGGRTSGDGLWCILWILGEDALCTHEFLSEVTLMESGFGELFDCLSMLMFTEVLETG